MATQSNNFTRSNVNASTLQLTDPGRSSFNLGNKNELTIPFGKIVPVSTKILLPSDTFSGSLNPNFHLEKIGTPSIGATRLDTHTFVVNFRRINKDMRSNLENGVNFFPSVNLFALLNNHLGYLFTSAESSSSDLYTQITAAFEATNATFKSISLRLIEQAENSFINLAKLYDGSSEMYYQKDKYYFLYDYYRAKLQELKNLSYTSDQDPRYFFQFCLPTLLKPFIGPSSLLDYLGYPCYSQYNRIVAFISPLNDNLYDRFFVDFKEFLKTNPKSLSGVIFNAVLPSYNKKNNIFNFSNDPVNINFSELPIRAYYSVWYDYLRNWHIEERKFILDPDNFDNNLVVPITKPANITDASRFLSFYTLRSRDYGTDFLTSIQTDDSFRHVYSPVFGNTNDSGNKYSFTIGDTGYPNPSNINAVYLPDANGSLFAFPSDGGNYSSSTSIVSSYNQDLQTMRRAGMLERWLARNYYYPDTYVGRLQARYGVRPSDYEILVSQYIGGSESFISGQELVANMSTSESVVGSRNFKADVSTTDDFSGSVSDYSILISVVSTVPIVSYDVISPAAKITDFIDFPQPEFATDTRVEARVSDFLRGFSIKPFIGYVPRYYMFRVSADESHGRYLTDYRIYNWLRDNYSMSQENFDFSLNPYSLRVNLPLDAFIGLKPWDDFAFGSCKVNLVVNRALPAAIEII